MTSLTLHKTFDEETFLQIIPKFTQLKVLSLRTSILDVSEEVMLECLTKLSNLESFTFFNGQEEHYHYDITIALQSFPKLTSLTLINEMTFRQAYRDIGLCTGLKHLHLDNCYIFDRDLKHFINLTNLESLEIVECMQQTIWADFHDYEYDYTFYQTEGNAADDTKFKFDFDYPRVKFTGKGLAYLTHLSNLTELNLSHNRNYIRKVNNILANCFTQLQRVNVWGSTVGNIESFSTMRHLTWLSVSQEETVDTLKYVKQLKQLEIHWHGNERPKYELVVFTSLDDLKNKFYMTKLHTLIEYGDWTFLSRE
jgi:hypothetical protein